jgi:peptide/nickel transport system permease protein
VIGFIVRRVALALPVLLGIVFVTFAIGRMLPGDPCVVALGEHANRDVCNAFKVRHGLDKPIPVQFVVYVGELLQGDLGSSLRLSRPVTTLLVERLPTTVELSIYALLFATFFGILLGLISALRHNSAVDVGTMLLANLGVSIPVFVLGLAFAWIFAIGLKGTPLALPPSGRLSSGLVMVPLVQHWHLEAMTGPPRVLIDFVSNMYTVNSALRLDGRTFVDAMRHMILPAVALGTIPMAIIARITRSSLLDVLGLDYTRTARAKGLRERLVVFRHAMRNAMLPLVTVIGLQVGGLLAGAILTETIFNLTGVGKTFFQAITGLDYTVVQGFTLVIAVGYVLINLLVDISYGFLDPRVRVRG